MLAQDVENLERKFAAATAPQFNHSTSKNEEYPELLSDTGRQAEEGNLMI